MNQKGAYKSDLRAEQAAATRQRIIEAATEIFAPWAMEMPFDEVAERARVSVRTVYRHFPAQRDLVKAVAAHVMEGAGWKPDELSADNLGATTARAFTYFGTLLDGHARERPSKEHQVLRTMRLEATERALAPLTEGMDPELARGICAVLGGLTRVQFLRAMHEQWGLDGAQSGRAAEWAINTLLDELRRREGTWDAKPRSKARTRKRK